MCSSASGRILEKRTCSMAIISPNKCDLDISYFTNYRTGHSHEIDNLSLRNVYTS